jgi:hypothetical protein
MKKLVLTTVCAVAMTGAAFAQGYVSWGVPNTDVTFETNSTAFSPLFGGGNAAGGTVGLTATVANSFDYALLYQSTPNGTLSTDTSVWDGTWTGASGNLNANMTGVNTTGLTHGGVTVATVNGQSGTGVQVNWANGVTNSVVLVGWSADLGTTWVGVSNILAQLALGNNAPLIAQVGSSQAFFGETPIGNVNPAATAPGNPIFASSSSFLPNGDPIFSLNTQLYLLPVPEPATMALAGLGGLSLLLFRRQRK